MVAISNSEHAEYAESGINEENIAWCISTVPRDSDKRVARGSTRERFVSGRDLQLGRKERERE